MLDSNQIRNSQNQIQNQEHKYSKIKLLGEGAFGKAYLVQQKKDGTKWVIKQIHISDMTQQQRDQTAREAKILEALNHPNIIKFKEIYRTTKTKLNIVMQYADGGDLAKKIAQKKETHKLFEEDEILDWFTQICLAIKHVHDRKIIHRDIKGQNIFITSQNIIKLGDFGIARVLFKTLEKAQTFIGTPYYLSPQIIENKPYSLASDIWSLGVLLYQMCALTPPFQGNSLQFLALKIVKGSYMNLSNMFSFELRSLVKWMLNPNPMKRPTINQILNSNILIKRIKNFLTESQKYTQFSHTILHHQNIFQPNKTYNLQQDQFLLNKSHQLQKYDSEQLLKQDIHQDNSLIPQINRIISNKNPMPQKGPPIIMRKTPIGGFFRPPLTNHVVKPINNQKPNFEDLINIRTPQLMQKPPLPKIKTPISSRKRVDQFCPNNMLTIIKQARMNDERQQNHNKGCKDRYSEMKIQKKNLSEQRPKKQLAINIIRQTQNLIQPKSNDKAKNFHKKQSKSELFIVKKQTDNNNIKPILKKSPIHNKLNPQKFERPNIKFTKKQNIQQLNKKNQNIVLNKPPNFRVIEIRKSLSRQIKNKSQEKKIKSNHYHQVNVKGQTTRQYQNKSPESDKNGQIIEQKIQSRMPVPQLQNNIVECIKQNFKQYERETFENYKEQQNIQKNYYTPTTAVTDEFVEFNPYYITAPSNNQNTIFQKSQQLPRLNLQKPSHQYFKMISDMESLIKKLNDPKFVQCIPEKTLQTQLKFEDLPENRLDLSGGFLKDVELNYSVTNNNKLGLDCLSDHSKLQDLKMLLQQIFGLQTFIKLYRIIEKYIQQNEINFEEIEMVKIINKQIIDIDQEKLRKFFPLIVTLVALQNNIIQ